MKYNRVLLKLSGEALMGNQQYGIDPQRLNDYADEIIEATGFSAAKVLSQLTILEIKGFIRRVAGRRVSLNTK